MFLGCPDGSTLCANWWSAARNGFYWDVCLPDAYVCDGRVDCPEGDDEERCTMCNRDAKVSGDGKSHTSRLSDR